MVHQNTEYFERCQTADYDPSVSASTRHACWTRWLAHYTAGQPDERRHHARARLAALEGGEPTEPLPGLGDTPPETGPEAPPEAAEGRAATAPGEPEPPPAAEDEPEAPPPEGDAAEGDESSSTASSEDDRTRLRRPPGGLSGACTGLCQPRWETCARGCIGQPKGCLKSCEAEYRICMAGCH
jgi:hypothetical protein